MTISTVKIINLSNTGFTRDKNLLIDDFSNFINNHVLLSFDNIQLQKIEGNYLSIKLPLKDENIVPLVTNIDYCVIKQETSELVQKSFNYCYFVIGLKRLARETIQLDLELDTVNTFMSDINNPSFELSDKTKILRQHKDRLIKDTYKDIETTLSGDTSIQFGKEYVLDSTNFPLGSQTISVSALIGLASVRLVGYDKDYNEIVSYGGNSMTLRMGTNPDPSYKPIPEPPISTECPNIQVDGVLGTKVFYLQDYKNIILWTYKVSGDTITGGLNEYQYKTAVSFNGIKNRYIRNIDRYSEGVNPILYKKLDKIYKDTGKDYYLVYASENTPTSSYDGGAISCFMCSSTKETIKINNEGNTYTYENILDPAGVMILLNDDNPNAKITFVDSKTNSNEKWYLRKYNGDKTANAIQIRRGTNNNLVVEIFLYYDSLYIGGAAVLEQSKKFTTSSITIENGVKAYTLANSVTYRTLKSYVKENGVAYDIASVYTTFECNSIDELDRTDSKLIKVIKLPYPPYDYEKDYILPSSEFTFSSERKMMRFKDLNSKLLSNITDESINPLDEMTLYDLDMSNIFENNKNMLLESKLYHSDYYQPKFTLDSFTFIFALESVEQKYYDSFSINFLHSNTVNSRYMFSFTDYLPTRWDTQDFNNILIVARNNELTLFNSNYINYLRTGYNYDVKNKQRNETIGAALTGLQIVGSVASFALSGVTGGASAIAGITLMTSAIASTVSVVNNIVTSEANMEQKLNSLRSQSASVSGSDDIDLMSSYTSNKAHYYVYQASDKVRKSLFDLFYYQGYIAEHSGLPNFSSRYWFNFVSFEPIFEKCFIKDVEQLDNFVTRCKLGITNLHCHNSNYDWKQEKENIEISLLEE